MFDFHIYVWLHVLANFYDIFIQTFPQRGHKQTPAIDVWTKMSILWDWILGLKARLCNIDDSDDEMEGGGLTNICFAFTPTSYIPPCEH